MLGKKKKEKIILPKGAKCSRCGRKIKENAADFMYVDGKLYCKKCAEAKRDWNLLFLMEVLDDDD